MPTRERESDTAWPALATLMGWRDEGGCEATDGCWVPGDGNACEHGAPTWAEVLGLGTDEGDP